MNFEFPKIKPNEMAEGLENEERNEQLDMRMKAQGRFANTKSNEIPLEKTELELEMEAIMKKFEGSLNDLVSSIDKGDLAYYVDTPIPPSPMGCVDDRDNLLLLGQEIEKYPRYGAGIRNCDNGVIKGRDGGHLNRLSFAEQLEPGLSGDVYGNPYDSNFFYGKNRINELLKKASVIVKLDPVNKFRTELQDVKEKGLRGFFKKPDTELVREERGEAIMANIIDTSRTEIKNPQEKVMHLSIAYQNEVYKEDYIYNIKERNQRNLTRISFYLGKEQANDIITGIMTKPDKIWDIIKKIEPNLLNIVPPSEKSAYGTRALLIKLKDKEDEIFPLQQEQKEVPIKPELPKSPDTPPVNLPPSAKIVSSQEWKKYPPLKEEIKQKLYDLCGDTIMIGKSGMRTEHGEIDGPLVWVDDMFTTVIFETPQGLLEIPFNKLQDRLGRNYNKRMHEKKELADRAVVTQKRPPKTEERKYLSR